MVNAQSGEVYSVKSPVEPPYPTTTEIATRLILLKTKKINEFLFASKILIGMKRAFSILGLHLTSETFPCLGIRHVGEYFKNKTEAEIVKRI